MARKDLSSTNFSDYAGGELDYVLKRQADESKDYVPTVTAAEAMKEKRLLEHKSSRDVTRVLFISQNVELLNPIRQTLDGYLNISEVFDEVHILILRQGIEPKQPVFRPEKNVFMYTAATKYWWQMPFAGVKMIKSQLVFANGFRPDLVVARDPFESALVALWINKKFDCPIQLHVLINFFHSSYLKMAGPNRWRRHIARYTIPKFYSIRAATDRIKQKLQEKVSIVDLERLPQLNPYEAIARAQQTLDLKEKYPQYVFSMLFVGTLKNAAAGLQAIDAARYMLRNPQICLIIMGDGPGRAECEKRVKVLGIEKQVIFEYRSLEYMQYLKAADLLIVTNTDEASEEIVLQAAGAGKPMVLTRTERRDDIFTHLESAYLCAADDVQAQSDGVHELTSNYELRQQLSEQAQLIIEKKFHQDPNEYRTEYRDSIEAALFAQEVALALAAKSEAVAVAKLEVAQENATQSNPSQS